MTHDDDRLRSMMNIGALYTDYGAGWEALEADRLRGKELAYDFNQTRPGDAVERERILGELLGAMGEHVWFEPPLRVSYGNHVSVGDHVYANFNLTLVDDAEIRIGSQVMFGPNVTLTTAGHPVEPALRVGGTQFSLPIVIEDNVWIGAQVVILPGVTIGAGSIVGAGSVVSRSIPPRVVAVGVPCRVLRPIGPEDQEYRVRRPGVAGPSQ